MKDRLKQIRGELKFSQRAIAEQIGIGVRNWQGYESGENTPGGKVLQSLANLGFNINWILTGKGEVYEYGIRTDFWSYLPTSTNDASAWMSDKLKEDIKKVIIIKYYDRSLGKACGFILFKNDGVVSMSGSDTRTGYFGDKGPDAYCAVLKMLQELNVLVGIIDLKEGECATFSHMRVEEILKLVKYNDNIIEDELYNTHPDKYPRTTAESLVKINMSPLLSYQIQPVIDAVMEVMTSDHSGVKLALTQNALMFQEMVRNAKKLEKLEKRIEDIESINKSGETDFKTLESQGEKQKAGGGN